MKQCSQCREFKSIEAFAKDKHKRSGRVSRCKSCISKYDAARYNPTKRLENHLKRQYSLSLQDYDNLVTKQGGKCAICGTKDPGDNRSRLCVDHCHDTGKVRGLLCARCNIALGGFKDSTKLLAKAILYLNEQRSLQDSPQP